MNVLGISCYYHDAAACLVRDGKIVAAAQEERFTRKRHDPSFPLHAINYCLKEGQIQPDEIDLVCFYDKPLLKFERILETYLSFAPSGFRMMLRGLPVWLRQKLHLPREIRRGLKDQYLGRFVFLEHHESHAASAFFPSPFNDAAILTADGVGEWATASIAKGSGNRIQMLKELRFPHSLGLLYSAFTYFSGFRVNSGEYKLMGLAPFGTPRYSDLIFDKLIDLKDDGSFRMDLTYFAYTHKAIMTSRKFDSLFGGPPRKPETEITQREMDLAASIQHVTEEILLRMVRYASKLTGSTHLVLAGGVALNAVANGRIAREGPFDDIWIQPAAGDAGAALGAALFCWYQLLNNKRQDSQDSQEGSLLGPAYSKVEIRNYLDQQGATYEVYSDEDELCGSIASLIASGKVIGHFSGRMEFGPRSLGARSIIGDPRSSDMQSLINRKIKFRESFRPFAPAVLAEEASEYFELGNTKHSPYMLIVAPINRSKRVTSQLTRQGIDQIKEVRSTVPAVTHVDNSSRIQTVDPKMHHRFYKILRAFKAKTGCPILINTSFNIRGEPIVLSPEDAIRCFMATDMDVLVLENFILRKEKQPSSLTSNLDSYIKEFGLD